MGSQFTEVHKMFHDFYEDDQRAADAAARAEAANYERNNRFDWENETAGWEDEE